MYLRRLVICIFLPLGFLAFSVQASNLNQTMSAIADEMVRIYPLIVAKRELSQQEYQALQQSVHSLVKHFHAAQNDIQQRSETYAVSYKLVLQHLDKIEKAFKQQRPEFVRRQLYSLGPICASCHTQDTALRSVFHDAPRSQFHDDFAYAEFNYFTRNYAQAIKYFDKFLRNSANKTELEIISPLQRLITIYTQIHNSPDIAAKQLSEYKNIKSHTRATSKQLDHWIKGLKELNALKVQQFEAMDFKTLESYVRRFIGEDDHASAELFSTPEDEVKRVWLRGQLFHYLNSNPPKQQIPTILYWLSLCDRSVGYSFNISFADLFLKECIVSHNKHPYARHCLAEYEKFIEYSYSGSGGIFVPPDIEDELVELKALLK
ncbi:MAG: hypothetical protein OEZ58_23830 [Gammaproteobacteria bacterium]|nr:hypothetical protein [Gammaproteobacteria bacterium]